MNEHNKYRAARTTLPIALIFDGPVVPSGSGAGQRVLSTARLLAAQGFPVTVLHAWRGWSEPDLLSKEPFGNVLLHPDDVYGATTTLTDLLRVGGFGVALTKTPSILAALLLRRELLPDTQLLFECHDLPDGESEERAACRLADRVVVLRPDDLEQLGGPAAGRVEHLPCFVAEDEIRPRVHRSGAKRIALLGNMFHEPNARSATTIAAEVMPLVLRSVPDAELHVLGPTPPALARHLCVDGVRVHGQVVDAVSTLRGCDVAVSAVLSGTGVRVKVLDYLAAGLPVVANELGGAGLPALAEAIVPACGPANIAAELVSLLRAPERRTELARTGDRLLRAFHTNAVLAGRFRAVFSAPRSPGTEVDPAELRRIRPGPAHWITDMLRQDRAPRADPDLVGPGRPCTVRSADGGL